MIIARNDKSRSTKGWYLELTHPALPSVGFATQGVDERHYHRELCEVYLVATGSSTIVVGDAPTVLHPGDVVVVEPGEVHSFVESTPDYFHFVLHCPSVKGDKVLVL